MNLAALNEIFRWFDAILLPRVNYENEFIVQTSITAERAVLLAFITEANGLSERNIVFCG
jgi:hypothetical protein